MDPIPELTKNLAPELRLRFYENLAFELTIVARNIWSDPTLADSDKVSCLKWANEIQHRITAKAKLLRRDLNKWTEEDSWRDIQRWVAQDKRIGPWVASAIRSAYAHVISKPEA
ncbi:MAG: hypothetical protein QM723_31675 [Myxococcaceae bacterium]